MTLDEAIQREVDRAKINRVMSGISECDEEEIVYTSHAEYHEQLAEWLRELKAYRESEPYKWNNHQVACLLADMFGDDCACNFNDISEWLPQKCEVIDACPHPYGVACWEQFLTHREVKADADSD